MNKPFSQLLLLLIAFSLPLLATARDYSRMYSPQELERANGTYAKNINGMLFNDIARHLLDDELKTLRRIKLEQPVHRTVDPFEFSANSRSGVMLVPTFSVKFLDDLAIAIAWYERKDCNKETVFDYVAAMDFSPYELPTLLQALRVPKKAYELDKYVDDVSQKILKSALSFIVLHELGHIHHRHRLYSDISANEAQAQETKADQFALKVLRRMRLPPLGMSVVLMALSMRDPLLEGSPRQTHPLNHSRLHSIAETLRRHPEDFIEPANRGRWDTGAILMLADEVDRIATNLEDPDLRLLLRTRGQAVTRALLKGGCSPEQHHLDWEKTFRSITSTPES